MKPGEQKASERDERNHGKQDDCRCKEVSQMKPKEMLRLMLSDLAFWRKEKKA